MPHLFEPLTLRGVTLRNRIGISPMCQYSCDKHDGVANDWHLVNAGSFALGGAGLFIAEASAVEARGRISPHDLGIWNEQQVAPLKRMTDFLKRHGTVAGIQLAHSGRKGSTHRPWDPNGFRPVPNDQGGWDVIGPSPIAFDDKHKVPKEMTLQDIAQVRKAFVDATLRSLAAGFEFVEIHAAHGYLINEFYSPLSNKRTDQYGGSFDNRIRLLMEIVRDVRQVWPAQFPLAVRISATEWTEGGWTIDDSIALSKRLRDAGVDLVDCSSAANVPVRVPFFPGYQVPLADRIRNEAKVATAAVGYIVDPHQADEIVRNGRADVVLLGRETLRNPHWPIFAAQALREPTGASVIPSQRLRAYPPALRAFPAKL